ncbi:MAG: hypothetical protein ABW000_07320 [Actinoplanes sp.]
MAVPFLGDDEVMERVELHLVEGADPQRCWRNGATGASRLVRVTFGRLGDGRWYANRTGEAAYVFDSGKHGEALALQLAYRWMRDAGGQWWATPAAYDARAEPVDGLPWVRRGGEWHLKALGPPGG